MKEPMLPPGAEPFNGYKKLNSVLIPISLGPVKGINWLDKFIYGRLRFEAGNSDRCRIGLGDLAKEMDVSEDSIARSIDRLSKVGLVYRKRFPYESLIIFLRSDLLTGSLSKSARSDSAKLRERLRKTAECNKERFRIFFRIKEGIQQQHGNLRAFANFGRRNCCCCATTF